MSHSCYQRAFRCMEYRPRIPHCNFDLANSLYGNCCISKTISARRSAEVSKSSQRNPLRFLYAWKGWKSTFSCIFIAFSEKEPFLRGFLCGKCEEFCPKGVIGCLVNVQKLHKIGTLCCDLACGPILTTPKNLLSGNGAPWCYTHLFNSKNHQVLKLDWSGDRTMMNSFGSHPVW